MAKLYFYYASMNAGKSTTLLQSAFNYRERGMAVMLFTAAIDDRGAPGQVTSRIGLHAPAETFDTGTDMRGEIEERHALAPLSCVLVDEAQFLSRAQVFELASVCDVLGIPVLAYGLRTDFRAELFEGSRYLLALADVLVELKAVCDCGAKATMNLRVDESGQPIVSGEQTAIGGNESYVALCRKHFMLAFAERKMPVMDQPDR